jgi:hypothetical protein
VGGVSERIPVECTRGKVGDSRSTPNRRVCFGSAVSPFWYLHLKFCVILKGLGAGLLVSASNWPRLNFSFLGAVAQLGERLICIQEVAGSIPTSSTSVGRQQHLGP